MPSHAAVTASQSPGVGAAAAQPKRRFTTSLKAAPPPTAASARRTTAAAAGAVRGTAAAAAAAAPVSKAGDSDGGDDGDDDDAASRSGTDPMSVAQLLPKDASFGEMLRARAGHVPLKPVVDLQESPTAGARRLHSDARVRPSLTAQCAVSATAVPDSDSWSRVLPS